MLGGFDFVAAAWADEQTLTDAFRTGDGIGWHQHDERLFGADRPEDNHHLLGRLFYAASAAICMPGSLAQDGHLGLGNQAGTARLTSILTEAGFGTVRVATRTPINVIIDARP